MSCLLPDIDIAPLITCEHGGNKVPPEYRDFFSGQDELLNSHQGYDIGALTLARYLAAALGAPLFFAEHTRLLVDLNRSVHHRNLFSACTAQLDDFAKQRILATWYLPYRREVAQWIGQMIDQGKSVLHLSVHTFTPVLNGRERKADIGVLYDPRRSWEKTLGARLTAKLKTPPAPGFICRRNYPYRGVADGMTGNLRKQYADHEYAGLEIEVNQKLYGNAWQTVCEHLARAIDRAGDGNLNP